MCDSKGIFYSGCDNFNSFKQEVFIFMNFNNRIGLVKDVIVDVDVFIGVSVGNLFIIVDIKIMAKDFIIFVLVNFDLEIMLEDVYKGGVVIVGIGCSDLLNQVNNVFGFFGIFRGVFDVRVKWIILVMKLVVVYVIVDFIFNFIWELIILVLLQEQVVWKVVDVVKEAVLK